MRRGIVLSIVLVLLAAIAVGQGMNNEAIIKMAKTGLGEDIIVSTIKTQPANYTTGPDDLIALKTAGVSDEVLAAMVEKMASAGPGFALPVAATVPAPPVAMGASAPVVGEVGVYFRKGDAWADLPPEVVNFKTGGVLKHIGTAGIVKGDVNGHLNGEHSSTQLKTPINLLVYTPDGVAITEYQLLRLRGQNGSREFRTVTGGVLHTSGGAVRDLLPFESKKVAPRTYEVVLPNIGSGDFGLLPPATSDATASSGRLGKIYSFRVVE